MRSASDRDVGGSNPSGPTYLNNFAFIIFHMPKTALVTGACGFTGTHMIDLLEENDYEIIATDLKRPERKSYYTESEKALHPAYYEDYFKGKKVEVVYADLTKKETLEPIFKRDKIDVVFHVASLYDYFAKWDELYKVNVIGAKNLAELASEKNLEHFVHWSTDGVYGEPEKLPADETAPYNPPNLYSKSKMEQEKILWKFYEEKDLPLTVLRPAPIYGPRHQYGVHNILVGIEKFHKWTRLSYTAKIYPKKKQLMFPSVHVTDLVRAALFVSEREDAIGEAYNVLSECITQTEAMKFMSNELGYRCLPIPFWWPTYKYIFYPAALSYAVVRDKIARKMGTRPKLDVPMVKYMTHQYWFSNQKIKDFGFEFIYDDPRDGLRDYIRWCKENKIV